MSRVWDGPAKLRLRQIPQIPAVERRPARQETPLRKLRSHLAVGLSNLLGPRGPEGFGILMYHRVMPRISGLPEPTWNVTPERFEAQLRGLLQRGYQAWPLRKVLQHHREQRPIPRKTFVVTMDDGCASVFRHAWPILQRLYVPATIFLATGYLDSQDPLPFDDWLAAGAEQAPPESWRAMTTDQCRQLARSGLIELGAHTHSHDDFRGRPEALREDLVTCLEVLQEKFGLSNATFAFPYGTVSLGYAGGELSQVARDAGLLCSLTTEHGVNRPDSDPFLWRRFPAEQFDTASTLAAKLNGWYCILRELSYSFRRTSA